MDKTDLSIKNLFIADFGLLQLCGFEPFRHTKEMTKTEVTSNYSTLTVTPRTCHKVKPNIFDPTNKK